MGSLALKTGWEGFFIHSDSTRIVALDACGYWGFGIAHGMLLGAIIALEALTAPVDKETLQTPAQSFHGGHSKIVPTGPMGWRKVSSEGERQ